MLFVLDQCEVRAASGEEDYVTIVCRGEKRHTQLDKNSKYKSRANQMVHTGRDHNHGHHLFNGCDHYSDANFRQGDKATHGLHACVKLQCSRRTKMLEVPHNDERLCKGLLKRKEHHEYHYEYIKICT